MSIRHFETFISIFQAFSAECQPMTLTALAEELNQPKSSMHNMIETLLELGLLYEVKPRRGYYPTRKLYNIAKNTLRGDPIVEYVQKYLDALARETGETALLSVRDGDNVVYLGVAESPHSIRYYAQVGDRRPVHATSGGKAIFSMYSNAQLQTELKTLKFESYSEQATTSPASAATFINAISEGRKRGWYLNSSEFTPEVSGVGIPIEIDERLMALSVAGPNYRVAERYAELADYLRSQAHKIAPPSR